MTRQRDFKALVRERMAKTGERYSAARAQLLTKQTAPSSSLQPGLVSGYDRFGGLQPGTSAVVNALRHAGITFTITNGPYTEAIVNGLCGGPGFLYAVFEYKGWPPILSLAFQSRSMPDTYIEDGLDRLGVLINQHETTSKAAAQKTLDQAISNGTAAICVVDIASLPWYGLPQEFVGGGPHVVTVAGRTGDTYWIDDRVSHPVPVESDVLANARAAYRKAKNRLVTVKGANPRVDSRRSITAAIAATAKRYTEPAVPKSFWTNCGFSGLVKWRQMLTDRKDRKSWPTVFPDGARAYAGLQRAYESIECHAAPGAGRAFYAEFLESAASILARPALASAASAYHTAGAEWSSLAGLIASAPDKALREACVAADRRLELGDGTEAVVTKNSVERWARRIELAQECRLSKDDALGLYGEMAAVLERIIEAERTAVAALQE
jgi:hypothetical protein